MSKDEQIVMWYYQYYDFGIMLGVIIIVYLIKGDDDDDYMKIYMVFEWEQFGFFEQEMYVMNQ